MTESTANDRARSLVLIIGAPRSGTTWLQSMLGSDPAIATPQETDLFELYVRPLVEAWDRQIDGLGDSGSGYRQKGLPLVLTVDEFEHAVSAIIGATENAITRMKPGAGTIVEKSPHHSGCVDIVRRLRPDARFIHMIRDGRDVAASLVAASSDWGEEWAPSSISYAAHGWVESATKARSAAAAGAQYIEVRYEELLGPDGPLRLQEVFRFCNVSIDIETAARALEEHSFGEMAADGGVAKSILIGGEAGSDDTAHREPDGFFRRGKVGSWRDEWSTRDRQAFASVGGRLLIELGYEKDDTWIGANGRPPLAVRAMHRFANSSARHLRSIADRVEGLPTRR